MAEADPAIAPEPAVVRPEADASVAMVSTEAAEAAVMSVEAVSAAEGTRLARWGEQDEARYRREGECDAFHGSAPRGPCVAEERLVLRPARASWTDPGSPLRLGGSSVSPKASRSVREARSPVGINLTAPGTPCGHGLHSVRDAHTKPVTWFRVVRIGHRRRIGCGTSSVKPTRSAMREAMGRTVRLVRTLRQTAWSFATGRRRHRTGRRHPSPPSRTGPDTAEGSRRPILSRTMAAPDIPFMTCRRELGPDPERSLRQAPSACRKWRRWPRELPGPANDNGAEAMAGRFHTVGLATLGCLVDALPSLRLRILTGKRPPSFVSRNGSPDLPQAFEARLATRHDP